MDSFNIKKKTEKLFRQDAIDHISSPEQIDQLIRIVKPQGWIALLAFIFIIMLFVIWLLAGNVKSTISGESVLMKTGGILTIKSEVDGRISDITVAPGDVVAKGQTIARIEQPELRDNIYLMREEEQDYTDRFKNQQQLFQRQDQDLIERINDLRERFNVYQKLFNKGIVTKKQFLEIKVDLKEALQKHHDLKNKKIMVQQKYEEFKRKLSIMTDKLDEKTQVTSPYSGKVIDVEVTYDSLVKNNSPLIYIEPMGRAVKNLEAIVFVPAVHSKKIRPGMQVNIAPYAVKSEEYGSMIGRVTAISTYPATFQSMMNVLRNDELVKQLLKQGVLVAVKATLIPDKNTYSGYNWTTPSGPPIKIQSGTLGKATIIIKKQRPYQLIIPTVKRVTGL